MAVAPGDAARLWLPEAEGRPVQDHHLAVMEEAVQAVAVVASGRKLGLQDDPQTPLFAVPLFDDGEDEEPAGRPANAFVDLPAQEIERIEALAPWAGAV